MVHKLKCWPVYFEAIGDGRKTFDVRKNDRNFQVGDLLHLDEYDPERDKMLGRWIICKVESVMRGGNFGIAADHCVMGIRLPANHQWPIEEVIIEQEDDGDHDSPCLSDGQRNPTLR